MFRESGSRRRPNLTLADLPRANPPYRELVGGSLALDFANTRESGRDHLSPGYGNLLAWSLFAGIIDAEPVPDLLTLAKTHPRDAVAIRTRALNLRDAIIRTVNDGTGLDVITDEWRSAQDHRHLTMEHGAGLWAWDDEIDLAQLLWPVVLDAVELLTTQSPNRIRTCEADGCEQLFLDTSRGGIRKFCRPQTCGTRTRVQRFRSATVSS